MAEAYDDLLDYLKEQDAPSTPQTSGAQPSAPKPPTFTEDSVSQASDQDLEAALSGYSPAPPSKKGIVNDVLVGLGKGAMEIPSAVTGLADIPAGLVGLDRPFDKVTDAIGEATGLQPKKWAEAAEQDYSPAMQRASRKINEAWQDPNTGALDVAKAYAQNPRGIMKTVVESLPSMFAGNAIGGKLVGLGKNATALTAEQLAKKAALGAGVGEGAVMAGQAMENIDKSVDPQAAAAAALATGVGGGLIGMKSGEIATKLGLGDINQIIASGGRTGFARTAEGAVPATGVEAIKQGAAALAKRVGAGALQEGPIEEGTQSALETAMQNLAEGKPIGEGMARNVVEGSLAGAAMGGGANVYAPKTAEQPRAEAAHATATAEPQTPSAEGSNPPAPAAEQPPPQDAATRTKAFVDATTERFRRNKVDINRMSMSEGLKQAAQENGIDIQGKAPVEIFNALRDLAYPPAPPAPKDPNIEEAERLEATGGAVAKAAAANLRSGASSVTSEAQEPPITGSEQPNEPPITGSEPSATEPPIAEPPVEEEKRSVVELEPTPEPEVDPFSPEELDKRGEKDLQKTILQVRGLKLPKEETKAKVDALRAALDRKKQNPRVKEQVEKPEPTILNSSPKTEEKQEDVSTTPEALSGIASEDNSKTPEPKQTLFKVNGADVDYNALTDEQKQAWDEAEANYRSTLDLAAFQHKMEPNTVLKAKTEKAAGLRLAAERRKITGNLTAKERRNAEIEASRVRPGSKLILEDGRTATAVNSPAYGKVKVAFEDGSVGNVPFAEVRVDTNPVEETNEEKRTGKESTGTGSRVDPVAGAAVLGDAGAGFAASDAATTGTDANPVVGTEGGEVNGKSQNPTPQEAEEPAQEQVAPFKPVSTVGRAALRQNEILKNIPQGVKESGKYKKTKASFQGIPLNIENGPGSVRTGTDPQGRKWSQRMHAIYGEIPFGKSVRGKRIATKGADKDHVDVFINPHIPDNDIKNSDKAYVIDQIKPDTGVFDESKVLLGYTSEQEASAAYSANYEEDWKGLGSITEVSLPVLREWLRKGDQSHPFNPLKLGNNTALNESLSDRGITDPNQFGDTAKANPRVKERDAFIDVPNISAPAKVRSRNAPTQKSISDTGPAKPEMLSDLGKGSTVFAQPKSGVNVPVKASEMDSYMLGLGNNDEVVGGVVKPVPIKMVNNLIASEPTPEDGLHNESVLEPLSPDTVNVDADKSVASGIAGESPDVAPRTRSTHKPPRKVEPNITSTSSNVQEISAAPEKTPDTTDLFKRLDSRASKATRKKAQAEISNHPLAERIQFVEDNFLDLLSDLEQSGKVKIKC